MKFTLSAVCLVIFVAVASASDAGHFIPKAFYTLDSAGHKSDLTAVNPHTAHYLRRLRRQTFTSSSSSSSSVQSSDGGPTFFTSQQVVQHSPDSAPAAGVAGIASRFGESSSTGTTGGGRPTGHVVQTSGVIDDKGRIHFKTQEGHF